MVPLGWNASALPLTAIDDTVFEEAEPARPLVLQNIEALLSLAATEARRNWFTNALARVWPATLVLPVTLYATDVPDTEERRLIKLAADALPRETLLDRLSGPQ